MRKGDYQIPFDKNGNQQDYPASWYVETGETQDYMRGDGLTGKAPKYRSEGPEWKDNFEFDDTLTLVAYGRGRSSVNFTLQRTDGTTVSMFVSDFYDAAFKMHEGKITGRFTFTKKGQNYGCRLVESKRCVR